MKLEIENLTKQYGNKMAIQNVSCTLKPGVVGLLGAGKSGKRCKKKSKNIFRRNEEKAWNSTDTFK